LAEKAFIKRLAWVSSCVRVSEACRKLFMSSRFSVLSARISRVQLGVLDLSEYRVTCTGRMETMKNTPSGRTFGKPRTFWLGGVPASSRASTTTTILSPGPRLSAAWESRRYRKSDRPAASGIASSALSLYARMIWAARFFRPFSIPSCPGASSTKW